MRGVADDFCVRAGSCPLCFALCTGRTLLSSRPHRSRPRNRIGKMQRVCVRVGHAVHDMNSLVLASDLAATSSNARCAVKKIANVLWSLFRSHLFMRGLICFSLDWHQGCHRGVSHGRASLVRGTYGFFAVGIESSSGIMPTRAVSISVCFLLWPGVALPDPWRTAPRS